MRDTRIGLLSRLFVVVMAMTALVGVGCGKKNPIDGTYHDASGLMTFDLHDGKCDLSIAGRTVTYNYQVSGKTVTLTPEQGRNGMTWTIQNDGSMIDSGTGGKITKAK